MTFGNAITLFGVMLVLAFIPSVSVLTVSARSVAFGFMHGVFTTLGIVVGDIVFIIIAIVGLSVLAETMGDLFVLVKYIGGAYLVWLGITLWRSKPKSMEIGRKPESSLLSSFLAGLLIALADQKAIFFYLGFFPAFIDLSVISWLETGIVIAMAALAIGSAKLGYAYIAARGGSLIHPKANRALNVAAGVIMIAVGVFLIMKA